MQTGKSCLKRTFDLGECTRYNAVEKWDIKYVYTQFRFLLEKCMPTRENKINVNGSFLLTMRLLVGYFFFNFLNTYSEHKF